MQLGEAMRTSYEEVKGHPLRSIFTLVGVILGTTALVIVLSVMDGLRAAVAKGIDDLGYDGVLIISDKKPSNPVERAKAYLSRGLRVEDTRWFKDNDLIQTVAPVGETRAVITAGRFTRRVGVSGSTPEFAIIKNRRAAEGRWFSAGDEAAVAPVCILGSKLKQQLFGGDRALGQQVNLGGRRLTVIGVGTPFDNQFVNDDDLRKETEGIYIPFSIYRDMFGRNSISYFIAKAADSELAVEAEDEATHVYARAHNGIHDVSIANPGKEMLRARGEVKTQLRNWKIVFFSIAGISLLIGGLGIFSVLKISIGERLFEIGLRKSIGATDAEIFVQFLIESVTLSAAGALIGSLLGIGCVKLMANGFPSGLDVSIPGLTTAAIFAISIGLFSGLYPSLSASRLQPVDALRH
jgi:putative ABC transport system permease protein